MRRVRFAALAVGDTAHLDKTADAVIAVHHQVAGCELDDEGALWFFVPSDGTLARDVEVNPRVCATYSDLARGVYVAMSGYARLIYDPDRIFALWDDELEAWFGQGPLDPRLSLLRVDVDHAEYWDEHSSGVIRLLALAHAALLREPPLPATEHRRLSLRHGNGSAPSPA